MELRLLDSLGKVAAADWDGLHDGSNPFISHAFLSGLETHGCLKAAWGWEPRHGLAFLTKIWMAVQRSSSARSIAAVRPPATETWTPSGGPMGERRGMRGF